MTLGLLPMTAPARAQLLSTTAQAQAALRQGDCITASELMDPAWQQFGTYAGILTRSGVSPYRSQPYRTLASLQAKIEKTCAGGWNGALGGSELGSRVAWILAGFLTVGVVVGRMTKSCR